MSTRIIKRDASDDYMALMIANGMERAGAQVISVMESEGRWYVWARMQASLDISKVDASIERELRKEEN
jgi:hypothetical protein